MSNLNRHESGTVSRLHTPKLGVQITGFFEDPFQTTPAHCFSKWNGNPSPPERRHSVKTLAANMKRCGADFAIYHVNPIDWQAAVKCNAWAHDHGFSIMLNNEAGQIYGPRENGNQSWTWDTKAVKNLSNGQNVFGLIHDESMHHQIHPGIEKKTNKVSAIANTMGVLSEEEAYNRIFDALQNNVRQAEACGSRYVSEEVIPIFFHAVARAGGIPGCKVLKEQNSVFSLTLAMSAAWQYDRNWMACIDLWEGDSGPWYQIMSRFSGHSVQEFRSALEMVAVLDPEAFYVESSDVLWEGDHPDAPLTEFGEAMAAFSEEFHNGMFPRFKLQDWRPEIAVIHPEDGAWGIGPWPEYGLLGSDRLPIRQVHKEWLKLWYHLMWGQADPKCLWAYQNPFEIEKRSRNVPGGDEIDVSSRPISSQRRSAIRQESHSHRLFHPLNNAVVLDQFFERKHLEYAKLIVVAGSYAPERIWPLVQERVSQGACCLCQSHIAPKEAREWKGKKIGKGIWWTVEDFCSDEAVDVLLPFRGHPQQWRLKSAEKELIFFPKDCWGNDVGWQWLA